MSKTYIPMVTRTERTCPPSNFSLLPRVGPVLKTYNFDEAIGDALHRLERVLTQHATPEIYIFFFKNLGWSTTALTLDTQNVDMRRLLYSILPVSGQKKSLQKVPVSALCCHRKIYQFSYLHRFSHVVSTIRDRPSYRIPSLLVSFSRLTILRIQFIESRSGGFCIAGIHHEELKWPLTKRR